MKYLILIVLIVIGISMQLHAQDRSKLSSVFLGKNQQTPLMLSLDVYPFLFLSNGGGGSIGLEYAHYQLGIIGFSVVPPDLIKNTFFQNSGDINIPRNSAIELYARYYLRPERKGIYLGIIGGPEWFVVEDNTSKITESFVKSYVVPVLGFRIFPFREYFYLDASFGYSFNLSGTEERTLGNTTYSASQGGIIYFLQIGARFKLLKN